MSDLEDRLKIKGISDVLAERVRQINEEGYVEDHDDKQFRSELLRAAICYSRSALFLSEFPKIDRDDLFNSISQTWPWSYTQFKPKDYRHNLVVAAALTLAEIERFDRANERSAERVAAEVGDQCPKL